MDSELLLAVLAVYKEQYGVPRKRAILDFSRYIFTGIEYATFIDLVIEYQLNLTLKRK